MLTPRSLLQRVRARLQPAPAVVGQAVTPAMLALWPDLEEEIDSHCKRPGTAAVSTWEVAAADVSRRLVGREGESALVNRFSDALVPTLTALQGPHKALPSAMREAKAAGEAQGTLAAATRPIVLIYYGMDAELLAAWPKTVDYLQPLLALARNPEALRADLLTVGDQLAEGAREADRVLRAELARLPGATDFAQGMGVPFESAQLALSRAIEFGLHRVGKSIAAALD